MEDEGADEERDRHREAPEKRADGDEARGIRKRTKIEPVGERERDTHERDGLPPDERRVGRGTEDPSDGPHRHVEDEVEDLEQELHRFLRRGGDLEDVFVEEGRTRAQEHAADRAVDRAVPQKVDAFRLARPGEREEADEDERHSAPLERRRMFAVEEERDQDHQRRRRGADRRRQRDRKASEREEREDPARPHDDRLHRREPGHRRIARGKSAAELSERRKRRDIGRRPGGGGDDEDRQHGVTAHALLLEKIVDRKHRGTRQDPDKPAHREKTGNDFTSDASSHTFGSVSARCVRLRTHTRYGRRAASRRRVRAPPPDGLRSTRGCRDPDAAADCRGVRRR